MCMPALLVSCLQFPSSYISRDEEVSELVLSMADVSTNLVMLTGTVFVLVGIVNFGCCSADGIPTG